jgi:hypothetical protein
VNGLLRLYPRPWRERYGEEFEALLADRPPSIRHRIDIVRGAVDARFHPELINPDHVIDRWWLAPFAGFGLLVVALLIVLVSPERFDAYGSYRDASAAALPWLGAVGLLLVGIARLAWLLPPAPRWLRVVASVGLSAGALWALAPWTGILAVTLFGATAIVAIGAWRGHVLPGWLAATLVVSLSLPIGLFVATMVLPWYALREAGVLVIAFWIDLVVVWPILALTLLRARRQDLEPAQLVPA